MTTTTARLAPSISAASTHVRASAMWRVQPGALMLLGEAAGPFPKTGSARISTAASAPGMFRAEFWPLQKGPGYAFLAAVRLPDRADRSDTAELILKGARGADRDLRFGLVAASDELAFGKQVADAAGTHAAQIARFMLDVMRSDDRKDTEQPNIVFHAFLTHAARAEGCVELVMHVPQKCVLLQGWGIPPTEPVELLLPGSSLLRYPAGSGYFSRSDLAAPMTGSLLALPSEAAEALSLMDRVFLLTGDNLLCRQVVEPRMLDANASVGQIRHLLPRLNCPVPMQALLRATLQPQYDGRDTLNAAGRPVRAALDVAVVAEGRGAYLSGWLFDPAGQIAELHLCAEGFTARLDEIWVRVPREDVSAAFRGDPIFPSPVGHEAGFAVATLAPLPLGQAAYLRFTFTDGDMAFMPVRALNSDAPSAMTTLLASVDLHKSSGLSVITMHLAPFIAQIPTQRRTPSSVSLRGPLSRRNAIVVPLRTAVLPRSFISSFLLDPAMTTEQIIFVCGPEWSRVQLEALIDIICFYELPASILTVAYTPRSADAVTEAALLSEAESFLLVSPRVIGKAPRWREELYDVAVTDQVVCPTVLFEDRSVRFAGSKSIIFSDRAPFVRVHAPFAGACASLVGSEKETTKTASGTFACCLIRRSVVDVLAHATRFLTESAQEAAFFLSLYNAKLYGTWLPCVCVTVPEDDPAHTAPASSLIDGWILRQTWGEPSLCAS